MYEYQYVGRRHIRHRTHIIRATGKVYIYVGMSRSEFEDIPYPEGFDRYKDLMVLDETSNRDPNMYAYQAQKVGSNYHHSILQCLKQYDEDFDTPWDRSIGSLSTEWTAHNIFAPFDESAQNVDFNNKEEGFSFFDYIKKAYKRGIDKYF